VTETSDLWIQYARTRDPALRERLILQYAPLVKYVVGRLAINLPAVLDAEDVLSYGTLGLIEAIERFDPSRGIKFETYAISRIRGAIIDGLRALDQIPRSTRQRAREIERALADLEAQLGRAPTDEEVAAHLGLELDRYQQALQNTSVLTLSLDSLLEVDDDTAPAVPAGKLGDRESPDPVALAERHELEEALVKAVQRLPDRERLVLSLYYYEELTMKEISRVMEISESRVCQLHAQAILRLRAYLRELLE
jgi:RNA polymerase sigma factor for flagellar operon FliA